MKITLKELRSLIRESVRSILKETMVKLPADIFDEYKSERNITLYGKENVEVIEGTNRKLAILDLFLINNVILESGEKYEYKKRLDTGAFEYIRWNPILSVEDENFFRKLLNSFLRVTAPITKEEFLELAKSVSEKALVLGLRASTSIVLPQ